MNQIVLDLERVLKRRNSRTIDRPRMVPAVTLAEERMDTWMDVRSPSVSERGGSSSPVEVEDRLEARRLAVQVARDRSRLPLLISQIEDAAGLEMVSGASAARLERVLRRVKLGTGVDFDGLECWTCDLVGLVLRYVEPGIAEGKLPSDDVVPGCVSCPRVVYKKSVKVGGHFAPVREDVKGQLLCNFCYRHSLALAAGSPITPTCWPPLDACELYHRQSPQAAGRWLAKQERRAS